LKDDDGAWLVVNPELLRLHEEDTLGRGERSAARTTTSQLLNNGALYDDGQVERLDCPVRISIREIEPGAQLSAAQVDFHIDSPSVPKKLIADLFESFRAEAMRMAEADADEGAASVQGRRFVTLRFAKTSAEPKIRDMLRRRPYEERQSQEIIREAAARYRESDGESLLRFSLARAPLQPVLEAAMERELQRSIERGVSAQTMEALPARITRVAHGEAPDTIRISFEIPHEEKPAAGGSVRVELREAAYAFRFFMDNGKLRCAPAA